MANLCRFNGIVIRMEWNDHNQPPFHVKYAGDEATIVIATLSKSGGSLPKSIERLVYSGSQSLDHETGKIRCIQTDATGSDQRTKCSSAGVR